jgi:hypothetical protein
MLATVKAITFIVTLFIFLKLTMIVRPQQHWLRLIFVWHGSVLPKIYTRLFLNFLLSIAVILMLPGTHPRYQTDRCAVQYSRRCDRHFPWFQE